MGLTAATTLMIYQPLTLQAFQPPLLPGLEHRQALISRWRRHQVLHQQLLLMALRTTTAARRMFPRTPTATISVGKSRTPMVPSPTFHQAFRASANTFEMNWEGRN